MIGTVRHKALRRLIDEGNAKGLPPDLVPRLRRLLSALHAADDLVLLESVPRRRPPSFRGAFWAPWSLSVSGNWRLVFTWQDGTANDLDLVDYH